MQPTLQLKSRHLGSFFPSHVVMMESASFMQSVLSPNPASTIYASTAPSYQTQTPGPQQTNGSLNAVAGSKRPFAETVAEVNGNGQSFHRPPQLNFSNGGGGRSDETPSRDESHPRDGESSTASPAGTGELYPKKKQKRNKPTLSCFECVERKTKACLFLLM